jgi:hypothetical protein
MEIIHFCLNKNLKKQKIDDSCETNIIKNV